MTNKKIFDKIEINENKSINSVYIKNNDGFLAISDSNISNGIDIIEDIVIIKNTNDINKIKKVNPNSYIGQKAYSKNKYFVENNNESKVSIINFTNTNLKLTKITNNLSVLKTKKLDKSDKSSKSDKSDNSDENNIELDLGQIILINKNLNTKELAKLYKIAIETKTKYFEYLKLPEHIKTDLNDNEFLILASVLSNNENNTSTSNNNNNTNNNNDENSNKSKNNNSNLKELKELNELEKLEKDLVATMIKSCNKSLKSMKISFGILDYITAEGITIDDLVEAGMELCVGIEVTKELKLKLKKQILKSLEDLNVIALLMTAIRVEEDFQNNRLREVDVGDDPAYLYTDEVLGIAIATQIAGTKAMFNFKRYDEAKPGIISKLGPMLDDIFAGLVAGAMSKIFEE
ncbi:MAG: phosphatidylglycerophosphatase A [Methanobacteriaceae archaeon]